MPTAPQSPSPRQPAAPPPGPLAEDLANLRQEIARLQLREAALCDRLAALDAGALPRGPRPGWPIRRLTAGSAAPRH